MRKLVALIICLSGYCLAGPVGPKRNMPIKQQKNEAIPLAETEPSTNIDPNEMIIMSSLSLPSNATSIRADITDGFSCENKTYGYYADVDNDCQIFHVCLPVTYANGKENTFRWSFICPEETIFSQDSFTCMRPDDMTINCEESYQYYELNRNFGMMESAADKENNNEAASEISETISEAVAEPKPAVQQEEENIIGQYKPVNVHKPARRKPSISYATQNKPASSYPLRKIPQSQVQIQIVESPANQVPEDLNENIPGETIKPVIKKFSRRPLPVVPNSLKDKIQISKPDSGLATRTELFNQIRKRPTMFNKKPEEQLEELIPEEQPKTEQEQQTFSAMASGMPISNTETKVAHSKIEASGTHHAFVKPEQANQNSHNIKNTYTVEEPLKVLDVFEQIPAIISEVVEIPKAEEEENKNKENINRDEHTNFDEEPQIIEEVQSAEENQAAEETQEEQQAQEMPDTDAPNEVHTPIESQAVKEKTNTEEYQSVDKTEAAKEEMPTIQQLLRTSAEETQNIDDIKEAEELAVQEIPAAEEFKNNESEIAEKTQTAQESKPVEEAQDVSEAEVAKETEISEDAEKMPEVKEPQIVEETETAEKSLPDMDLDAAKETAAIEDSKTSEETQDAEKEISEVQQNLRTSAEEIQNSKKTHVAEDNQAFATQIAEKKTDAENNADASEITQSAEGMQDTKLEEKIEDTHTTQEEQIVEESNENKFNPAIQIEETEITIPAATTLVVEEAQPILHSFEGPPLKEDANRGVSQPIDQNVEPETQIFEEPENNGGFQPIEEGGEAEKVPITKDSESLKDENVAEPNIIEENVEEILNANPVHTIEQMESEKPSDAPESIQATEEMSHPHAMVQQMYENMDMNKQSIGALKPVDPVMAHEAEQLIVDFINTLRRNDFTNDTPGMHLEHDNDETAEQQQQSLENEAQTQEAEKVANSETNQFEDEKFEEEAGDEAQVKIIKNKTDTLDDHEEEMQEITEDEESKQESNSVAEENEESNESANALKSLESQKLVETSAEAMSLPQEMYQIPVKVIAAPIEQLPLKDEQSLDGEMENADITLNTEKKVQEELPVMPTGDNKPLSIDYIVELVKERLDHMPKDKIEAPMQLAQVLDEAKKDKAGDEKTQEHSLGQVEERPQQTSKSEEEIVMPIYQRTVEPIQIEAGVQTEDVGQVPSGEEAGFAGDVTEVKEKTNRSFRSHSMSIPKVDSRKRRFFFKTESS